MSHLDELRAGLDYVVAELTNIDNAAEGEALDEPTQARWDEGVAFVAEQRGLIQVEETREAQRDEIRQLHEAARTIPGDQRGTVNVNLNRDPFDLRTLPTDATRSSEIRSRAIDVIEKRIPKSIPDDYREAATKLAEREGTPSFNADEVRTHLVRSASPEYVDAFRDYLQNPNQVPGILTQHEARTAMSLTAANGGVLVPQFLDPTIVITNDGANNNIRQLAGHAQITVDQWDGVTSAGMTAEWLGEGSEAADKTPTFVGPTITVHKAAAYAFASYEVLMDSGFNEFATMVADAKDRLEETAFTTGNGSGQPWGLISRLSGTGPAVAGSSGAAGAADFVAADVYAVLAALPPRWRRNAVWLANISTYNAARQFATANNYHAFWTDFMGDRPGQLLGKPAYEDEAMDSTRVSGSNDDILLFGDLGNGYKIVDRIGLEIMYNPLVIGSSQRPTGQAGFFAFWRVGADVITSNAFKLLRV